SGLQCTAVNLLYSTLEYSGGKNMKDFSGLTLHMLSSLSALVAERSVSRAAERMGVGQPSMSKVLAKLRLSLEDPILVRTAGGLVPTARALQICEGVRRHLEGLESALDAEEFNPAAATGRVSVATADTWLMLLFPQILHKVRRMAPGITVTTRDTDNQRV